MQFVLVPSFIIAHDLIEAWKLLPVLEKPVFTKSEAYLMSFSQLEN